MIAYVQKVWVYGVPISDVMTLVFWTMDSSSCSRKVHWTVTSKNSLLLGCFAEILILCTSNHRDEQGSIQIVLNYHCVIGTRSNEDRNCLRAWRDSIPGMTPWGRSAQHPVCCRCGRFRIRHAPHKNSHAARNIQVTNQHMLYGWQADDPSRRVRFPMPRPQLNHWARWPNAPRTMFESCLQSLTKFVKYCACPSPFSAGWSKWGGSHVVQSA